MANCGRGRVQGRQDNKFPENGCGSRRTGRENVGLIDLQNRDMIVGQKFLVINVGQDLFGEIIPDGRVRDGIVARVVLGSITTWGSPGG